MTRSRLTRAATLVASVSVLAACGMPGDLGASGAASSSGAALTSTTQTVTNCGVERTFPNPVRRIVVNDSGMISMLLAIGAQNSVVGFSSLNRDADLLARHHGDALAGRRQIDDQMPGFESILALRPDLVVAGWGYGYAEGGVTPDRLTRQGVAAYELSEACRQADGGAARGTMDPWTALETDLRNLGRLTGRSTQAEQVVADLTRRREALTAAPAPSRRPNVLVFDRGDRDVFTSGRFGAPQAILQAAGGRNVMDDVDDTWTTVSWERVAASAPDAIVFVDYGEQSFAQKVAMLESNPATRDLPAVREKRYLNLPYAMWVSSPLNVDAAEQLRHRLEGWGLVPRSGLPTPVDDHVDR